MGQTDGQTPYRYIDLAAYCASSVKIEAFRTYETAVVSSVIAVLKINVNFISYSFRCGQFRPGSVSVEETALAPPAGAVVGET